MKQILILAAGAGMLALGACTTTRTMELSALAGKWNIVEVDGQALAAGATEETPYLGFDVANGSLTGFAGCNRIMGSFSTTLPEGELDMGRIASTRMSCPDLSTEQRVIEALNNVKGYRQDKNGRVVLTASDGKSVITLTKAENDVSASDLNGSWKITELDGNEVKPAEGGDAAPEVSFDSSARTYSFATGCNNITGQYTSTYTDFSFDMGAATMMACPDMTVEDAVKAILPQVRSFAPLDEGSYAFYNAQGDMLMRIAR